MLRSMLEASELTLVPGKQITLGIYLAFTPVTIYAVSRFWAHLPKHRLHVNQKPSAGEHRWSLMKPLGETRTI
jgi:hypothetical protein